MSNHLMAKEPLLGVSAPAQALYMEGGGAAEKSASEVGDGRWDPSKNRRYPDNAIRTSKYTLLTFLPKNLLRQFSKAANLYFLLISFAQM